MKTLAIIGGGASGLAAAISAAREQRVFSGSQFEETVRIAVYEASDRLGRSILATGNGRCNFSNENVSAEAFRNSDFVAEVFAALCKETDAPDATQAVHEFFRSLGLLWRFESEGRMYPLANKASSVRDVLLRQVTAFGIEQHCDCPIRKLVAPKTAGERWHLHAADGAVFHADAVVLCYGGASLPKLLPESVESFEPVPVLGPLKTDVSHTCDLDNIRVRCAVSLAKPADRLRTIRGVDCEKLARRLAAGSDAGFICHEDETDRSFAVVARERGEVLFRSYGISGIAVFNLSRLASEGDRLLLDFFPDFSEKELNVLLRTRMRDTRAQLGRCSGVDLLTGAMLPAVAEAVLKRSGVDAGGSISRAQLARVARVCKEFSLEVKDIGDERQCQVKSGGVSVDELDSETLELRKRKSCFVVGEAADIDAPCGGFNLHWAWASGMLAGMCAMRNLVTDAFAEEGSER